MQDSQMGDRAAVQLVDVLMALVVLVAIIVLAPFFNKFRAMITGVADPLTGILLSLFIPLMLVGLLLSIGRSARGGR